MGRRKTARDQQRYPALLRRPVRSVLVIKPRAIGDVVLSTVVLPNLRAAFPGARIAFLTERAAGDIVRDNTFVDEPIVFDREKDSFLDLLRRLRRERYDLVFDLFCNPRSAQMTFATGAPVRVGYPFRGRAWAYNVHVETRADRVHNTEFNLDALSALDIPLIERRLCFPLPEDRLERMAAVTAEFRTRGGPLIALNPSGTWGSKRWGLQHFARLGDMLVEALDASIVLLWGPGEEGDVETIRSAMRHPASAAPPTGIGELGALLAQCDYTISNDSGPMHISAAVGTSTLGIFGPTNPLLQGPFGARCAWVRLDGLDCLGCNLTRCEIGNICMRDLTEETVLRAFMNLTPERT